MKNLGYLYKLFINARSTTNVIKNAKDIPTLTQSLLSSQTFRQTCVKIHNAKGKLISILDNEAFPESKGKKDLKTTDNKHNHHGHHHKK